MRDYDNTTIHDLIITSAINEVPRDLASVLCGRRKYGRREEKYFLRCDRERRSALDELK